MFGRRNANCACASQWCDRPNPPRWDTSACARTHARAHANACAHMHACTHSRMRACASHTLHTHTHAHACMRTYASAQALISLCRRWPISQGHDRRIAPAPCARSSQRTQRRCTTPAGRATSAPVCARVTCVLACVWVWVWVGPRTVCEERWCARALVRASVCLCVRVAAGRWRGRWVGGWVGGAGWGAGGKSHLERCCEGIRCERYKKC